MNLIDIYAYRCKEKLRAANERSRICSFDTGKIYIDGVFRGDVQSIVFLKGTGPVEKACVAQQ